MFTDDRILDRELGLQLADEPELRLLEQRLQKFCASLRADPIDENDEHAATRHYIGRLAEAGLLQLVVPKAHGGSYDPVRAVPVCLARQWLARESGALDTAFVMQGLGSHPIALAGSDDLKREILPKVVNGRSICAFAITEPSAGSDVTAMETIARPDGDHVILEGEKCFISNAGIADSYTVFTREALLDSHGQPEFGAFWVPGDADGLEIEPTRVIAPHPIGTVRFRQVRIPATHRLGKPGDGLQIALRNLDLFRPTVGAAALGFADRAFQEMIGHLQQRVQFGKPLAKQQGLRFALAELATEHLAAQLLVYRAAAGYDKVGARTEAAAMAKLAATESAQRVVDRAVQSLGGRGVMVGNPVERLYREVRALRIYEGTSEIQKLVIARAMFSDRR